VHTELQGPVLVTGGTGFVGSHLLEALAATGVAVRCLARRTSSLEGLPASVEVTYGDLRTGEGLAAAAAGVAIVFHVAGVTKAFTRQEYFAGNLEGTVKLLAACGDVPRFVHVSSLAAVGPNPDEAPLTEDAPPRPVTWYGESKRDAEHAVRDSALADRAAIVRPPVVYGPRDKDVYEVFRSVSKGWMVEIGRGDSWFSYLHAADLAEALIRAGCAHAAAGRTYFVANAEPISWHGFARAAAGVLGRRVRTVRVPGAVAYAAGWCAEMAARRRGGPSILSRQKVLEGRCRRWVCDTSRARAELGWCPRLALERGIHDTVAWYKDAGWL
jgi:nucleoside-diphosphate-sugar epimerase